MFEPCPTCDAKGHVKATATIAYEVLRRIQREATLNPKMSQITAHVHPSVAQFLHQHEPPRCTRWRPARKKISLRPGPTSTRATTK